MGKRASAIAVLLAISFLGSLLALVLVGENPLLQGSRLARPRDPLAPGVEGGTVTVSGPSPAPSRVPSEGTAPVAPVRGSASDDQAAERGDGTGPGDQQVVVEPEAPPPPLPALEEVESEPATITLSKGTADGADKSDSTSKEAKVDHGKGGPKDKADKAEKVKGSGKGGPKDEAEKAKGSGKGTGTDPAQGNGKKEKP